MAGPWEKYQQQEAPSDTETSPAEAPPVEAPPAETAPVEATPAPRVAAPVATAPTEQAEGPWTKYQQQEAPSEPKKKIGKTAEETWAKEHPIAGRLLSAATGVADVMPFRKDIQAGLHAVTDFGEGSLGEKFSRAKAAQDRAQKALAGEYPMMHLAGNIAPFIMAPELALTAPETAAATKMAPYIGDIGSKVVTSGLSGAGLGALYGAGEGDTLEERAKNIKSGAGFGLLGGVAAPAVGAAAKKVAGYASELGPYFGIGTEKVANKRAKEEWDKLIEHARKGKTGMTAEQVAESEKYGQPVFPIDVMGQPGNYLAKRISAYDPEAKQALDTALGQRNLDQQNMFKSFLSEKIMKIPGVSDIFSDVGKARIKAAADAYVPDDYKLAFKHPENQNVISPELENALQYSHVQKAIPKAFKAFNDDRIKQGQPKIANPFEKMEILDNEYGIKQGAQVPLGLWDQIKREIQSKQASVKPTALSPGKPALHQQLSSQSAAITKSLKDLNLPGYNEALEGASKYKGEQTAWDLGAKFANVTDPQKVNSITAAIKKLAPEEQEHFAQAYTQNMFGKMLGAKENRNIGNMLNEQQKAKNIAALGEERAMLIHDYLDRANQANKSYSGLGGSDTSRNIYDLLMKQKLPGAGAMGLLGAGADIYSQLTNEHGNFDYKKLLTHAFEGALAGRAMDVRGKLNAEL